MAWFGGQACCGPGSEPVATPVVDQVEEQVADRVEEQVDVPTQRHGTTADLPAPAATEAEDVPGSRRSCPSRSGDESCPSRCDRGRRRAGRGFHTEPKAASRDSEHGGLPGDREEAEGYVEEIPAEIAGESADDTLVWTSEAGAEVPEAADVKKG